MFGEHGAQSGDPRTAGISRALALFASDEGSDLRARADAEIHQRRHHRQSRIMDSWMSGA